MIVGEQTDFCILLHGVTRWFPTFLASNPFKLTQGLTEHHHQQVHLLVGSNQVLEV